MKLLKMMVLSAAVLLATVGASHGAPAAIRPAMVADVAKSTPVCPANGEVISLVTPPVKCSTWPTFTWKDNAPAGGYYDVEVATDPGFSSIVDSSDSSHTSACSISAPATSFPGSYTYLPATTYFWRIQTYDSTCNVGSTDFTTGGSGWAVATFYTAIPATDDASPNPRLPANGSYLVNNLTNDVTNYPPTAMFQWNPVTNATGYILQVSLSPTFSSSAINVSLPATKTTYSPTVDLAPNRTYSWRVETLGGVYGDTWSDIWSFTTTLQTAAPTLSQPQDGNLDVDFTPGLLWKAVTVPGTTTFTSYEVQAWTDKTFTNYPNALCFDVDQSNSDTSYLANLSDGGTNPPTAHLDVGDALNSISPPGPDTACVLWTDLITSATNLPANTTIYWRVRTESTDGTHNFWSDWSSAFSLRMAYEPVDCTTMSIATGATTLTYSASGALLNNMPIFSWGAVPGTYVYTFQISKAPNFATTVVNAQLAPHGSPSTINYRPPISLPPGVNLFWRVRASSVAYGPAQWSCPPPPFEFQSSTQPSTPLPKGPGPGALLALSPTPPTLHWSVSQINPVNTFDHYEVQVATDAGFVNLVVDDSSAVTAGTNFLTLQAPVTFIIPMDGGSRYYWRVRAYDSAGQFSNWSRSSWFATILDTPINLVSGSSTPMQLNWDPVHGASGYLVEITWDSTFKAGVAHYALNTPQLFVTKKSGSGPWYWRVQASSKYYGKSPWTDGTATFTMPP